VLLICEKPDESSLRIIVTTFQDGSYSETYNPDVEGIWNIYASWEGTDKHDACSSQIATFTLDMTTPTLSIISPSIGSTIKSPDIICTWSGTDDLSGIDHYEIKLNEDSWVCLVETDTSCPLTELHDGGHTISIKAIDMAGNSKVEQINFTVNTSIIGGPGWADDITVIGGISLIIVISLLLILRKSQVRGRSYLQEQ
jgi:hypothetical protein